MAEFVGLAAAAARVPSGCVLGVGGMTLYRRPVALVRELIRAGVRDLELIAFTGGIETDLLIGAGRVRKLRSCYVGLETFGLAPMFTAGAPAGGFELVEETEVTIALGLRAALARLDFMPHRGLLGTDLMKVRPDLRTVRSPYSDDEYLAVPPLRPQVALLHGPRADRDGNVFLGGNLAVDRELAGLADTTIVSVEEVVERLPPFEADLPGHVVDLVVEVPGGARPGSCWPCYPLDGPGLLGYLAAAHLGRFDDWLAAFTAPGARLEDLRAIPARLGLAGVEEAGP